MIRSTYSHWFPATLGKKRRKNRATGAVLSTPLSAPAALLLSVPAPESRSTRWHQGIAFSLYLVKKSSYIHSGKLT